MAKPRNQPSTGHANRINGVSWSCIMSMSSWRAGSRRTAATGSESPGARTSENNATTGSLHTPDQMVTWNAGSTAPEKLSPGAGGYNLSGVLRRSAGFGLAIVLAGALTGPATAQSQRLIFPGDVARFEFPLASPRTSAMVGRILDVSRGESLFGAEWEAEPALGEVWPLVAISRGKVPVTLHLGTEVYARFSLADKSSALISDDWQVNGVLTADYRRWRLAFEAYHESSHLGDEYRDRFPTVTRVNWSREIVGLWAAYVVADVIEQTLVALLAGGNCLLIGVPGQERHQR